MISTIRSLWRQSPKLLLSFVVALCLTLFFLGNIVWQAVYWANHRDLAVQPWMTVGYIGKSWDLDPPEIDKRAGLPLPDGEPKTLLDIAAERGVPVSDLVALVEETIAQMRAEEDQQ